MNFNTFLLESAESLDILEEYLLDPLKAYKITAAVYKDLVKEYSNKKDITIYRGMNFASEKDYTKFVDDIKDNKVTFGSISSWTRHQKTAEQFAKTRPSYMEYMDDGDMELIKKAAKEHETVVGFRGIILKTTIKAGTALDVNRTEIGKEDEIILPHDSTVTVEVINVLKNSDRIKADGIDKILKQYANGEELVDNAMILNIINNHADKLTDEHKGIIGKFFLTIEDEENIFTVQVKKAISKTSNDTIIVRLSYESSIEKYKDIFLQKDVENYNNKVQKILEKGLKELVDTLYTYEDPSKITIDWVTNNDRLKIFKQFNVYDEYKKVAKFFVKEYDNFNKDVMKSNKTYSRKDLDDFKNKLKQLLNSI